MRIFTRFVRDVNFNLYAPNTSGGGGV